MGGTVVSAGATFRVWAPRAKTVYVSGDFNDWRQNDDCRLDPIGGGHWAGFFPSLGDGDQYLFYVDGIGTKGFKRDPRARDLTFQPSFPASNCVLRDPYRFPWHDTGFRTPPYNDLMIYQLHVGTYSPAAGNPHGNIPRRDRALAILGDAGRKCHRAAADTGISDNVQPRIQRNGFLQPRG